MRFTPGLWVHEKFMDVAIDIIKVSYQDDRCAKLKIWWWNRGWVGNPFKPFPTPDKIIVTDFTGWKKIDKLERTINIPDEVC